jgi:hypothetical protein
LCQLSENRFSFPWLSDLYTVKMETMSKVVAVAYFKILSQHLARGTMRNHGKPYSRSANRHSNSGPPEALVLTSTPCDFRSSTCLLAAWNTDRFVLNIAGYETGWASKPVWNSTDKQSNTSQEQNPQNPSSLARSQSLYWLPLMWYSFLNGITQIAIRLLPHVYQLSGVEYKQDKEHREMNTTDTQMIPTHSSI